MMRFYDFTTTGSMSIHAVVDRVCSWVDGLIHRLVGEDDYRENVATIVTI